MDLLNTSLKMVPSNQTALEILPTWGGNSTDIFSLLNSTSSRIENQTFNARIESTYTYGSDTTTDITRYGDDDTNTTTANSHRTPSNLGTSPPVFDEALDFNMSEPYWEIPTQPNGSDGQAFIYVSAVVVFYGALLMTLLGIQMRRRNGDSADEDYYALLVNRDELARRDIVLRQKMNVLRIDSIKDGHTIDLIPEHTV